MEQYISKSALVEEITRIKGYYERLQALKQVYDSHIEDCNYLLSFLDTLEVEEVDEPRYNGFMGKELQMVDDEIHRLENLKGKEVDLDKEIDKFYGMYRKDGQTFSLEDNEECVDWKVDCNPKFEKSFAKHFFELGISVSNKAQKGERV